MTAPTARFVRRRPSPDVEVLQPAPAPEPARWLPALLDALAAVEGGDGGAGTLRVGGEVAPLGPHDGPWTFAVPVVSEGGGAPPLGGDLAVRLVEDRAQAERELAAMALADGSRLGAPARLGIVDLDGVDEVAAALVWSASTLPNVPELIGLSVVHVEQILGGFGEAQADLHRSTAATVAGGLAPVPALDVDDELDRMDADRFGAELARLRELRPAPGEPVLCHGAYQPFCVYGPGPAGWDAHGGPGHGLIARNWCNAVLAEAEFDAGYTLLAFWMAPFFAPTRAERTSMRMVRGLLSTAYQAGYQRVAPLDDDRLRFWQVFHALRTVARLEGAYDGGGSVFAVGDRSPLPTALSSELGRFIRTQLR